jgi:hypothetical protein
MPSAESITDWRTHSPKTQLESPRPPEPKRAWRRVCLKAQVAAEVVQETDSVPERELRVELRSTDCKGS